VTTDTTYRVPTYSQVLVECLTRFGDRDAFVLGDRRLTYRQAADTASTLQQALASLGVRHHGAVAVLSPNMPEAWLCQTATYLLGARYSGLHPLGSVTDHAYVCDQTETDVLVVHPSFAETGAAIAAAAASIRHVVTLGPSDLGEDLLALARSYSPRPLTAGPAAVDDVAWLPFTGGTTGRPKGVMLSHRAMTQEVLSATASWGVPQHPRYLAAAPITHAGALPIVPTLCRGGTVFLQQGFDPHAFLRSVQDDRVNYGFIVPTMLYALLDLGQPGSYDLSSLETLIYGAAPATPARVAEAVDVLGPVLLQAYGQTESVGMGTSLLATEHSADAEDPRLTTIGRPVQGMAVGVLDEDGNPCATGTVGELCLQSPAVMSGYWRQPALTAEALAGGWLHTGDMAVRDDAGFFHIVDRKKDMIISGGFNVYPKEVEDVIALDPDVAMAAVVGLPDDRWGEAVTAYVVSRPGGRPDAQRIIDSVRAAKGPHQAPKAVYFVEALPLTALGKVDKKALRGGSPS
jgi:fatty-acyl-CoA synthase